MPWQGSPGSQTFSRTNGVHTGATLWQQDAAAGIGIRADYADTHDQDLAGNGINSCLKNDGGNTMQSGAQLKCDPGSSGAPGITFVGDLGTGLFHTAAGQIVTQATVVHAVATLTDGTTVNVDLSQKANIYRLTTTHSPTINPPTNPVDGMVWMLEVLASGGARTPTLSTSTGGFNFPTDIPSISQITSGKTDKYVFQYRSSANVHDLVAYVKGF